jgi:hypothetical protein
MSHDKIADALGISNEVVPYDEEKKITVKKLDTGQDQIDDYVLTRSTLRSLIEVGANSLTELLTVAQSSQKARDYEVAAKMMDTLAGITKTMKDLHKKELDTSEISKVTNENVSVDKAIFVGTTKDLMKALKEMKEE